MEIILGTVQFGMDYGITNKYGQTAEQEVTAILNFCANNNIKYLDTAAAYGTAEKTLGINDLSNFNIITKLPALNQLIIDDIALEEVSETFKQSLQQLNVSKVEGLLLHHPADYFKEGAVLLNKKLFQWKQAGLVNKIGISVYDVEELENILALGYEMDIVQIPLNIFNQSFLQSDILGKLKRKGIEIHVRSLFLQGIILANPNEVDDRFQSLLQQFQLKLQSYDITAMEAAIRFVQQIKEVDAILVGVNNLVQLEEIVACINKVEKQNRMYDFSSLACKDVKIIDPRNW